MKRKTIYVRPMTESYQLQLEANILAASPSYSFGDKASRQDFKIEGRGIDHTEEGGESGADAKKNQGFWGW